MNGVFNEVKYSFIMNLNDYQKAFKEKT